MPFDQEKKDQPPKPTVYRLVLTGGKVNSYFTITFSVVCLECVSFLVVSVSIWASEVVYILQYYSKLKIEYFMSAWISKFSDFILLHIDAIKT